MTSFIAAVSSFVGLHFVLSSRAVRPSLVGRLGAGGFAGLYSVLVLASFVWMVWAFGEAPYVHLWTAPGWTRLVPLVVMPFAFLFLIAGNTTKSPTAVGQESRLGDAGAVRGIVRITRHPALWGFTLWALSHVPANGDARSVVLFSGFTLLAVGGMAHIDARRARQHGEAWESFRVRTSVVPFAAIFTGRQTLSLREIGVWRPLAALAAFGAVLLVHEWVIGVPPWP